MTTDANKLRALLSGEETLAAPGAYDALSARTIAQAGYPFVYISGLANEASDLGYPDLGFTTAAELIRRAAQIKRVVDVPVVCDADTGFGGMANLDRTVREFEAAGIAAIHLEDQTFPKRCGILEGKDVVSSGAFCDVIQHACSVRDPDKLLIIARTDAKHADGIDGVIERLNAYVEAGADAVMTGDFYSSSEYRQITASVNAPLVACAADPDHFHLQPDYSNAQWQAMGVKVVVYWHIALFAALGAVRRAVEHLRDAGKTSDAPVLIDGYAQYARAVELDKWLSLEDD